MCGSKNISKVKVVPTLLLAFVLMSVLLIAGVEASGANNDNPKTLVYAQGGDIRTLDPSVERGASKLNVIPNISEKLLDLDANLEPVPALAKAWEPVDETTWKIELREGIKFHNGEPLDAKDAKFSIERILDPSLKSDYSSMFENVESVEVVNKTTLLIHTKSPSPLMPYNLAHGGYIVPHEYIEQVGREKFAEDPIGTGPYKLAKYKLGEYILLEANDDYWRGRPAFDQVKIRIIPEPSTRSAALRAGEVDIAENLSPIQAEAVESAQGVKVVRIKGIRTAYLQLIVKSRGEVGPANEALQNKKVRQAIAYAIDVDTIIEQVQQGLVDRVKTVYSPLYYPNTEELEQKVKVYNYNPDKARRLLEEAGYSDGFPFVILYAPGYYLNDKEVAQATVGYLQEVGIDAKLEPHERATWVDGYLNHTLKGDAHWVHIRGIPFGTPEGLMQGRFHKDALSATYWSEETNTLLEKLFSTVDQSKRFELLVELAQVAQEEMPLIPFYSLSLIYGVNNEVEWQPHPSGKFNAFKAKPRKE